MVSVHDWAGYLVFQLCMYGFRGWALYLFCRREQENQGDFGDLLRVGLHDPGNAEQ